MEEYAEKVKEYLKFNWDVDSEVKIENINEKGLNKPAMVNFKVFIHFSRQVQGETTIPIYVNDLDKGYWETALDRACQVLSRKEVELFKKKEKEKKYGGVLNRSNL